MRSILTQTNRALTDLKNKHVFGFLRGTGIQGCHCFEGELCSLQVIGIYSLWKPPASGFLENSSQEHWRCHSRGVESSESIVKSTKVLLGTLWRYSTVLGHIYRVWESLQGAGTFGGGGKIFSHGRQTITRLSSRSIVDESLTFDIVVKQLGEQVSLCKVT